MAGGKAGGDVGKDQQYNHCESINRRQAPRGTEAPGSTQAVSLKRPGVLREITGFITFRSRDTRALRPGEGSQNRQQRGWKTGRQAPLSRQDVRPPRGSKGDEPIALAEADSAGASPRL